ncbi:MAG: hypothetical protein JSW11_05545 [Candidatus Heimdallarchaeota archaeon]|nr:MAG: hypothetical protein JSW11_05545 [Candidatus Heimdallarchaeota archaeon]
MSISRTLQRFYLHSYRHRTVVGLAIFLYVFLITGIAMFYPGEETLVEFIQLMTFLGDFPTDNPGFSLWLIFFCGFSLSLYLPVAGVFLGTSLLPIKESDGKEILFSTPKSLTISFLENSVTVVLLIGLLTLPSYIVSLALLYINNAWDAAPNITICFSLAVMLVIAITFLTAFGCSINFSKVTGYAIGGLYIVFSIVAELTANQISDLDSLRQLSLFSQAEVVNNSLSGSWNGEFLLLVIVLVSILVVASIVLFYRKDFLETGVQQQTIVEESEEGIQVKFSDKISSIRAPMDKLLGRLGWKYPAVRDQFHASAALFIIYLGFMIFYAFYVIGMYMEEELGEVLQSFNMPFMEALLFGNKISDTIIERPLETFLAFEIYSFTWMIIAPLFLVFIYDILTRDYKNGYAEITWVLPKTGTRIFISRTMAALVYFLLISLAQVSTLFIMEGLLGRISKHGIMPTLVSYLISVWGYCVIFVFFLALALLVPSKHALKTLIIGWVFFVLIIFIAFLPGSDLSWMRFLTPFGYFDPFSIILDKRTLLEILPEAVIGTILTVGFYIFVLTQRVPTRDYLV